MIVTIHEAKTQLSQLIQRALTGEEILVAKSGDPVVKLTPVIHPKPRTQSRILGSWTGKVWIADDFDAELPDDLRDAFYNGPMEPLDNK